ncbi:unnamed protein product (macronuclear) [Paramecium tetraurelia]|uniref:ER membrane protein complex subunit 1 n=1 Tax=Paramecium tetraurelia TaxID=5888 RepID=A0CA58_PARTE|nr:uncharacterized protein GSPATT00036455001 [Paramecium tetraurelia]CAK67675.1 unnamed protein product [Paramecium tetraurelia]|eukprot:XP_001435072.1 hypothetical protein (macronuclear) [Paramecium tetraurelia strain d4-2]
MNFLLISLITQFTRYSLAFTITEVEEPLTSIKIHANEHRTLNLDDARDAILLSYNHSRGCEVTPLQLQFETQEFRIIQPYDFTEKDFESDTILNFRQFVSMVHIKDGMLAITSDSVAYLLKFNYNTVFEHDFEEKGQKFARILWKADLQTIAPSLVAKNELPQLLFSPSTNLAFLLFSDTAQLFSMEQMESQTTSLDVYQVTDWRKRGYRGLTKEIDGLVFSAVGRDGLDVYKIVQKDLRFIKNLKLKDFGLNSTIEIVDFAIVKHGTADGYYSMFLLDRECGLLLIDVHRDQYVNFGLRSWINFQSGGISVDTRNGRNVFMAYQSMNHHYVLEYYVDLDNGNSFSIRKKRIDNRIIDLDATDDFVIVQGVNQHLILFSNGYDYVMNNHQDQVFKHLGLRDFAFFNQSYKLEDMDDIKKEYQYDDFFFGITAQSAFLTRFQMQPIKLKCFYHQSDVGQSFTYILQYNTTVEGVSDLVVRHTQMVNIEIIKTYFYEAEYYLLYSVCFLLGSVLLMGLGYVGYWFYNFGGIY